MAEFSKDDIEALLNEEIKGKKLDLMGELQQIMESNTSLKLCVKWFQGIEQNWISEKENLQNLLDCSEKKCVEIENARKSKEDENNALQGKYVALLKEFAKEKLNKLMQEAIASYKNERYAGIAETLNVAYEDKTAEQTEWEVICSGVKQLCVIKEQMLESEKDRKDLLEEYYSKLRTIDQQLDLAKQKRKSAGLSLLEARIKCEEQRQLIIELENRLAETEIQVNEKKLPTKKKLPRRKR
ncbi:kinesin-like protein KIN-14D [Silene latifolia]|uniref:kinesin-like protein KIN-14D n=1 Tax=Silene latifolia TaxID=37657 RepID=UPI003D777E9A